MQVSFGQKHVDCPRGTQRPFLKVHQMQLVIRFWKAFSNLPMLYVVISVCFASDLVWTKAWQTWEIFQREEGPVSCSIYSCAEKGICLSAWECEGLRSSNASSTSFAEDHDVWVPQLYFYCCYVISHILPSTPTHHHDPSVSRLPLKVSPATIWISSRASSGIPNHMGPEKVPVGSGHSVGYRSGCCLFMSIKQSYNAQITFISKWDFLGMDLSAIGQDSAPWEEHPIDSDPVGLCHREPWRDQSIVWRWTIWKFPSLVPTFVVRFVQ